MAVIPILLVVGTSCSGVPATPEGAVSGAEPPPPVSIEAPPQDIVCDPDLGFIPGSCVAKAEVAVVNTSTAPVVIDTLSMGLLEDEATWTLGPSKYFTFDKGTTIAPGERIVRHPHFYWAGTYGIEVTVYPVGGGPPTKVRGTKVLTNPTLDAAMEACEACNGDWGAHGITGTVACLCRTSDGGKPCDDGLDCEGYCVATEDPLVPFECAEFTTTFGCFNYLPDGFSSEPPPTPGQLVKLPLICID